MDMKWIILIVTVLLGVFLLFGPKPGPQLDLVIGQGTSDQIAIFDARSGREIMKSPAGKNVHGVGVAGDFIYAGSYGDNNVYVIHADSGELIGTVDAGGKSHHAAVSPDERYVLFAIGSANSVAVLDTTMVPHAFHDGSSPLIAQIPVGEGPSYPVFAPDGQKAYVTNLASNTVSVIDMAQLAVINTVEVGKMPDHAAISPDGRFLYVTNGGSNDVSVIDTTTDELVASVSVGKGPHGVAASQQNDQQRVYVGNRGETTISVIDVATNQVIELIEFGASPEHLTASPDGMYLFIGVLASKSVLVLDTTTQKVIKTLKIGTEVHQIAVRTPQK